MTRTVLRQPAPATSRLSPDDAASVLAATARGWPGPAIVVGANGVIRAASSLSGLMEGMRAPFDVAQDPRAFQQADAGGRRWRVSAEVGGLRFAVVDHREEPDAAHRFTAAVSHEIRTPLNGILGMTALLEEGDLSPSQRDYAAAIRKSGARLLDLLNNVLDYSRMEAGDIPLEHAPFDPADLVQDVAELLAPRAHAAGLDLAAFAQPGLAPRFMGDAGRIRQVLFNLTGNAVKFTERGAVLVEARWGEGGRGLTLLVRDTGAGVPEEARDRLFEAFGQARASDAAKDGGVGLGLAIVARLVAAMKGTITVESVVGSGSTFRVDLPLETFVEASNDPASPPCPGPSIVMDLPPASMLACFAALSSENAQASAPGDAASTGAQLAILDAALPPARIEAMAKRRPTLVVLRPEDRSRIPQFRAAGCAGYLIRPLRPASVVERVRHALAGNVEAESHERTRAPGEAGRVLIADDNAVNALLASRALSAAGFHVDTASTGAEALERAGETAYAVIFMDIRMPVMDGIEATRRIRALSGAAARTPIIALTADIDPDLEERARAAGVTAMAAKPIDPPRLRALAERWSAGADAG